MVGEVNSIISYLSLALCRNKKNFSYYCCCCGVCKKMVHVVNSYVGELRDEIESFYHMRKLFFFSLFRSIMRARMYNIHKNHDQKKRAIECRGIEEEKSRWSHFASLLYYCCCVTILTLYVEFFSRISYVKKVDSLFKLLIVESSCYLTVIVYLD